MSGSDLKISDLARLYFEADEINHHNGQIVTYFVDKMGKAWERVAAPAPNPLPVPPPAPAEPPIYRTNRQGGRGAICLNGGVALRTVEPLDLTDTDQCTIMAVYKLLDSTGFQMVWGHGTAQTHFLHLVSNATLAFGSQSDSQASYFNSAAFPANYNLFSHLIDLGLSARETRVEQNAAPALGNYTINQNAGGNLAAAPFGIGGDSSGNLSTRMEIAAFLLADRKLSAAERAFVAAEWGAKYQLSYYEPLEIRTIELPDARLDDQYAAQIERRGGLAPFEFEIEDDPKGLFIDHARGNLYGTILESGDFNVKIRARDAGGAENLAIVPLHVSAREQGAITLSPFQIEDYHGKIKPGETAELRFYASADLTTAAGRFVSAAGEDELFFERVPCSILPAQPDKPNGAVITANSVSLPSTQGAAINESDARLSCKLFVGGKAVKTVFEFYETPSAEDLGKSAITLEELTIFNHPRAVACSPRAGVETLDRNQILNLLRTATHLRATNLQIGEVKLSTAPFNPLEPVAVGDNDPRVGVNASKFQTLKAALDFIGAVYGTAPVKLSITETLYTGTANVTVPDNVLLEFSGAGALFTTGSHTVYLQCAWTAGLFEIFQGTKFFDVSNARMSVFRPEWWGGGTKALFDAAFFASSAGGKIIDLTPGKVYEFNESLNLDGMGGVTFRSESTHYGARATLRYTGGNTARAISIRSTGGIRFERVKVEYTNPQFTGILVGAGHDWRAADTAYFAAIDSTFTGSDSAHRASALLTFDLSIICRVERCNFAKARAGIKGVTNPAFYSNIINILDCQFVECDYAIRNVGANYNICFNTFEPANFNSDPNISQQVNAVTSEFADYYVRAINLMGNYIGDMINQRNSPVRLWRVIGGTIIGNWTAITGGPAAAYEVFDCECLTFTGNRVEGAQHAIAVTGNVTSGLSTIGNNFTVYGAKITGLEKCYGPAIFDATLNIVGNGLHVAGHIGSSVGGGGIDLGYSTSIRTQNANLVISVCDAASGAPHQTVLIQTPTVSGDSPLVIKTGSNSGERLRLNSFGATVGGNVFATGAGLFNSTLTAEGTAPAGLDLAYRAAAPTIAQNAQINVLSGASGLPDKSLLIQTPAAANSKIVFRTGSPSAERLHLNEFGASVTGNLYVTTNALINGTLTAGTKNFVIDHPLDPANKNLVHAAIESPRFDLIYRGKVILPAGQTEIVVSIDQASGMTPGTFAALTKNPQAWAQNETDWAGAKAQFNAAGDVLTIKVQTAGAQTVSWLVAAERDDAFIKQHEFADASGSLDPEHLKPEMTAAETAEMATVLVIEDADLTEEIMIARTASIASTSAPAAPVEQTEIVNLRGRRGFKLHPGATDARPMRAVERVPAPTLLETPETIEWTEMTETTAAGGDVPPPPNGEPANIRAAAQSVSTETDPFMARIQAKLLARQREREQQETEQQSELIESNELFEGYSDLFPSS